MVVHSCSPHSQWNVSWASSGRTRIASSTSSIRSLTSRQSASFSADFLSHDFIPVILAPGHTSPDIAATVASVAVVLFRQFVDEDLGCASYLVGDEHAHTAVVVDPAYAIEQYLDAAERHEVEPGVVRVT